MLRRWCLASRNHLQRRLKYGGPPFGRARTLCPTRATATSSKSGKFELRSQTLALVKEPSSHVLDTRASAATIMDSNVFMDTVLTQKMPSLVRGNTKLYPFSSIPDFHFKIKSTGLFNRDLKVNATEGAIRHLDTAPHRKGSCQPPVLVGGKTTVACELDLSGINTTFLAKTKGDNLAGTIKSIWVNVNATKVLTDFEAAALPGKDASVQTFRIKELELKTKYDKSLSLGDDRKKDFRKEFEKKVQTSLYEVIYNEYKQIQSLCNALDELDNQPLRCRQDFMSQKKAVKALLRFVR
ncbi:hypothetical protein HPB51_002896 [Rhipicephalus microplus]|uniref:Uncharacterized protein n=1 Tax=Rhipicephalus microplus TaxID=6941 RepID=A0A9J6EXR1_RHIMP|nr:hypothetical protein HPB51_002896 [Rhipicephalus microplus]